MRADLEAIEARCKAATEGPWTGAVEPCQAAPECDDVDLPAYVRAGRKVVAFIGEGYGDDYEADAAFIAHARSDLPALVAEVRELRAELENERGEGVGPSEGWWVDASVAQVDDLHGQFGVKVQSIRLWRHPRAIVFHCVDGVSRWFVDSDSGEAPTARSAMRLADLALNPAPAPKES